MGINLSGVFSQVIDTFSVNSTVYLKRVTQSINKYGDDDPTYTSEQITVSVNDMTAEEQLEKFGTFVDNSKLFFIKSTVTQPNNGDLITYNSNDYEIVRVLAPSMGEITHYECLAKKN